MGRAAVFTLLVAALLAYLFGKILENAAKHGALSNDNGMVHISWAIARKDGDPLFRFEWRERGGPPVQEPVRKGFGRTLLETSLSSSADSKPRLVFHADGFVYEIEVPLAAISDTRPGAAS